MMSDGNRYIDIFNKCFNYLATEDREYDKVEDYKPKWYEYKKKKIIFDPFKKMRNQIEEYISEFKRQEFYRHINFANNRINTSLTYRQLWEFCQFVRYADKVIFYKNELNGPMYVDTSMDNVEKREFLIKHNQTNIYFHLESQRDNIMDENLNIIKIKIEREYGKKLLNEYTIVNESVNYSSKGDIELITVINELLYDSVLETFDLIIHELIHFFEGRKRWERTKKS